MAKENAHKTKTRIIRAHSFADLKKNLKKVRDFEKIDGMRIYAIVSPKIRLKDLDNFVKDCVPMQAKVYLSIGVDKLSKKARSITATLVW